MSVLSNYAAKLAHRVSYVWAIQTQKSADVSDNGCTDSQGRRGDGPRPLSAWGRSAVDLSAGAIVLLTVAGFVAGAINAAAGGGSLVSFPALVALGYPSLSANVTNNVAVAPGYIGGAVGYRHGLRGQRGRIIPLAIASAVGSLIGVGLLLVSTQRAFEVIVPFLVLVACALIAAQPAIARRTGK